LRGKLLAGDAAKEIAMRDDIIWTRSAAHGVLPMAAELYLHAFRRGLLALPEDERLSIIAEIREQIADQAGLGAESLTKLLARLGPPDQLARHFTLNFELAATVNRANPFALLMVVLASATRNLWALAGGLAAALFYVLSAGFAIIALLKPVLPHDTGFWITNRGDIIIGVVTSHSGTEILGYWIIPLAVAAAILTLLLANALLRAAGIRLLSASRPLGPRAG
jgi:hypothetical protein